MQHAKLMSVINQCSKYFVIACIPALAIDFAHKGYPVAVLGGFLTGCLAIYWSFRQFKG